MLLISIFFILFHSIHICEMNQKVTKLTRFHQELLATILMSCMNNEGVTAERGRGFTTFLNEKQDFELNQ